MATDTQWLASAHTTGMLVSETVLLSKFKEGPIKLDSIKTERFKRMWDRFQVNLATNPQKALRKWIDFVLEELLEINYDSWITEGTSFERLKTNLVELQQILAPKRAIIGENDTPLLLLMEFPIDKDLNKPETETSRWRASPITKMERLLRETDCRLGLVSNGKQFGIVYAAPGLTTSHLIWEMQNLVEESESLEQFYTLLRQDAFLGPDETKLESLAQESQRKQIDVTDQLGDQVLSAIETFIEQLDKCDGDSKGKLLEGVSPDDVYEMALVTMVRLIFLLYSEERGLLPHGHPIYDSNYGISHLIFELEGIRRETPEYLEQSTDAWERIIATIRLVYSGSPHPDLVIKAYRGDLFNPDRFPTLESKLLSIPNSVIYHILRSLSFSETRVGGKRIHQRVSYRMLDVEQIGSVYEGLMEYKCKRANETLVVFSRGNQAIRQAGELVSKKGKDLLEYLSGVTGEKADKIETRLKLDVDERRVLGLPSELRRFHAIIRPRIIHKNQLYVTRAGSTRKGSGSYYTPKEITRFLVKQALRDKVQFEDGRPRSPREILSLKACDPAMGSGAFLVQAARYLAERLVESWTILEVENPGIPLSIPYGDPLEKDPFAHPVPQDPEESITLALRLISERCLYGVDKNPLAVDIAKASLWLVTLSKDRPFTFLDHHLKCGDSLVGARLQSISSVPSVALPKGKRKVNDKILKDKSSIIVMSGLTFDEFVGSIRQTQYQLSAPTMNISDRDSKERQMEELVSTESVYSKLKRILDLRSSIWFWSYAQSEIDPPHSNEFLHMAESLLGIESVIEYGANLDRVLRHVATLSNSFRFFHWELEFPEVFIIGQDRKQSGFDAIFTNPPWDIIKPNSKEFFSEFDPLFRKYKKERAKEVMKAILTDEEISGRWQDYKTGFRLQSHYYRNSEDYANRGVGDINTYKLFLERCLGLLCDGGRMGILIPSEICTDKGGTDLRNMLFEQSKINHLISVENRGKIFDIHRSFRFVLLISEKGGPTSDFNACFLAGKREKDDWNRILTPDEIIERAYPPRIEELGPLLETIPERGLRVSVDLLRMISPDETTIIEFKSEKDVVILEKLYRKFSRLGEKIDGTWNIEFSTEFHLTSHSKLFVPKERIPEGATLDKETRVYKTPEGKLLLPLYEGKMIWQYDPYFEEPQYWIREEDAWSKNSMEDRTLYRCAFRDVSSSTNERTVICSTLPPAPHGNTLISVITDSKYQNFISLLFPAIMNSFVVDYVMRSRITNHLSYHHVSAIPFPRINPEDALAQKLVSYAALLSCLRSEFSSLWSNLFMDEWNQMNQSNTNSLKRQWEHHYFNL